MAKTVSFTGFSTNNMANPTQWKIKDINLVNHDLMNHFNTRLGSRLMMPEYGTIIWDLIFEPFNDSIREKVVDDVKRVIGLDSRVELIEITVSETDYGITVSTQLLYNPWNVADSFAVDFDKRTIEG